MKTETLASTFGRTKPDTNTAVSVKGKQGNCSKGRQQKDIEQKRKL
jgi:hypothetical protein